MRDTVLFGIAAITLSLLFAIHTGLIAVEMVGSNVDDAPSDGVHIVSADELFDIV
jgi:hypothetical protein